DNGVSLDFAETTAEITPQHYAFLVGEEEFDAAFARIRGQDLPYWADPGRTQLGVINHRDGGRGLYFEDPDGHLLEIITRPYGGGSSTRLRQMSAFSDGVLEHAADLTAGSPASADGICRAWRCVPGYRGGRWWLAAASGGAWSVTGARVPSRRR